MYERRNAWNPGQSRLVRADLAIRRTAGVVASMSAHAHLTLINCQPAGAPDLLEFTAKRLRQELDRISVDLTHMRADVAALEWQQQQKGAQLENLNRAIQRKKL